jgi:hypothetical protein
MSSPSSPGVNRAPPDRGTTPAMVGFPCALVSFVASLAAMVPAGDEGPIGNNMPMSWWLGLALQRLHGVVVPDTTSSEAMLLFTDGFQSHFRFEVGAKVAALSPHGPAPLRPLYSSLLHLTG